MKFSANASLIFIATIFLAACGAKSSDESQVRALIDSVEVAAEARDASDERADFFLVARLRCARGEQTRGDENCEKFHGASYCS